MFVQYLFCLFLFNSVNCMTQRCPKSLTWDITNGSKIGNTVTHSGIKFSEKDYFHDKQRILGCVCNIKACIRKCCPPNEILSNMTCIRVDEVALNYTVHEGIERINDWKHHFVYNKDCNGMQLTLTPEKEESDEFYIQRNGSLFLPQFVMTQMRHPGDYCVDLVDEQFSVVLCLIDEEVEEGKAMSVDVNNIGMIISMPFLLATFIAYALLPDRNLHMKALMFYVINLFLSYLLLVIIQLSETRFSDALCASMGYFCLLFFLVSFFWMNVICFDIWLAFSGLRGFSDSKKKAERKRFLIYCAYAWGVPILQVAIIRILDVNLNVKSLYKPGIGEGQCFLKRGYPELLYFYGPMALIITVNIILFSITAFRIRSVKKETQMLKREDSKRHSYENDKQTFNLYLKLLFAMGVNWSMEIISWAVIWADKAPEAMWYLTDFCNAIYGVFIFFIFVFKRSIWKLLKKRYYSLKGQAHLAHSTTMTTRVTSYSTANSSVTEHPHGGPTDTSTLTSGA